MATYTSVFTMAFSLSHKRKDAKDVTNEIVLEAIRRRLRDLEMDATNSDIVDSVWPPEDTAQQE